MIWNNRYCFTKIIPTAQRRERRDFATKITKIVDEQKMMNNKSVSAIKIYRLLIGSNAIMNKNVEVLIGIIWNVQGFRTKIYKI